MRIMCKWFVINSLYQSHWNTIIYYLFAISI